MPSRILLNLQWSIPGQQAQWPLSRPRIRRLLDASLGAQADHAEITVRLVGSREGRLLNRDFRGKDYATNVLTFGYTLHPVVQADLVLCLPVLVREAKAQNKDLAAHVAHMLIHGMLHAQGFDHLHDDEAEEMESMEQRIMRRFRLPDPYSVH
ncbi:MAG: hypothetical protein RLZZ344_389 [Pseudomonadota bacterium]